jgi:iron(III) transport system substrate-binding protein
VKAALYLLLALAAIASAQERKDALARFAAYEGADREERLIEGARREGFVSLYTSFPSRTSPR